MKNITFMFVTRQQKTLRKLLLVILGLKVKFDDPKTRASFVARHNCDTANDKTSASYWSCRLPRFAKQVGLSGGGSFFGNIKGVYNE